MSKTFVNKLIPFINFFLFYRRNNKKKSNLFYLKCQKYFLNWIPQSKLKPLTTRRPPHPPYSLKTEVFLSNVKYFIGFQIFYQLTVLLPDSIFYQIPSMTQVHLAVEVESTSKASAGVSYPPGKRRKNCKKFPKKFHLQSKSWRQSAHCL